MTTQAFISQGTMQDAAARIGDADHCQAGGAIALSGALAAALGQATANSTLGEQPTPAEVAGARQLQTLLSEARSEFLRLADQDANAILEFVGSARPAKPCAAINSCVMDPATWPSWPLPRRRLCSPSADVCECAHDDLEFALTLMTGAARAAMQLLDSNLRIWPLPELHAEYEPAVTRLVDRHRHPAAIGADSRVGCGHREGTAAWTNAQNSTSKSTLPTAAVSKVRTFGWTSPATTLRPGAGRLPGSRPASGNGGRGAF